MMELKGALVELRGKVWLRRGLRFFIRCGSISNQKININNNATAAEESSSPSSSSGSSRHVLEGMLLQKGGVVSWAEEEGERGGGVLRMKIVVRKSDLKHLVMVSSTSSSAGVKAAPQQRPTTMSCVNVKVPYSYSYSTAEHRLNNLLWKKQNVSSTGIVAAKPLLRGNNNSHHKCWSPVLQSIPE